jgi:STE24 endopeptidase
MMMRTLTAIALALAPAVTVIALMEPQAAIACPQMQSKPALEEAPVPVPPPDDKALSYYRSGNVLWVVDLLWGCLVPALFLFTGLSARIRNWAWKLGRKWFFVVGIYFIIYLILNAVIGLPLSYYEEFIRQHAYGLSNQTPAKWLSDALKSLGAAMAGGFFFLWIPYLLLRVSPRRWWLYSALFFLPLLVLVMLITPVWIDPLFNRYEPIKDKALEARILALADRAGIEGSRVFEVNKSVDTGAVNAYVTGFWGTKRIVLWDTILAKLNENELLVVVGHEMGHYVLYHIVAGMIAAFLLVLAALYLAHRMAGGILERYRHRFEFDQLSDVASLPLLLILVGVIAFILSPAALAFSRYQEHEADRFSLEITQDNHAAATAFTKVQRENLAVPRPGLVYVLWRASHPPIGERIDFCNEYRPWKTGQPLRYGGRFKISP